ncbi:hypothetical protein HanRHA438_Chr13g0594091 [Helianthus annuus]|nr:hypothetical protein HanRHA438_Chr13g0594091 [Helianthus annuus]
MANKVKVWVRLLQANSPPEKINKYPRKLPGISVSEFDSSSIFESATEVFAAG